MSRWEQSLVNAQVEVNRAVFLMNARFDAGRHPYSRLTREEVGDKAIIVRITSAIDELEKARAGLDKHERGKEK